MVLIECISNVLPHKPPQGGGKPLSADHPAKSGLMSFNRFIFSIMAFFGVFLTVSISGFQTAQAQPFLNYQASSQGDQPANGVAPGTGNTGTDLVSMDPSGEKTIQVMVWDGPRTGYFSWHYAPDQTGAASKGEFKLDQFGYIPYCDPDVAIARINGEYIAMVVGIGLYTNDEGELVNRILVTRFRWNDGSQMFELYSGPCENRIWLGNAWAPRGNPLLDEFASLGRKCYSPNIDANEAGQVAIVWCELEQNTVRVITIYPDPPFSLGEVNSYITISKGNVYGAQGHIDGSDVQNIGRCLVSPCKAPLEYLEKRKAQQMENFPVGLPGELTEGPTRNYLYTFPSADVAISEFIRDKNSMISFTFLRVRSGNTNSEPIIASGLFVSQKYFFDRLPCFSFEPKASDPSIYEHEDRLLNQMGGPPRIAAPGYSGNSTIDLDRMKDYVVVQGGSGGGCDDGGYFLKSSILAWGKQENNLLALPSQLLQPNANSFPVLDILNDPRGRERDMTYRENFLPVVSYVSKDFGKASLHEQFPYSFTVAWQSFDEILANNTAQGRNILAANYFMDFSINPADNPIRHATLASTASSTFNYSVVNNRVLGRQVVASIAGRHGGKLMAYDWDNNEVMQNYYKRSDRVAGTTNGLDNDCPDCLARPGTGNGNDPSDLIAQPNPSNGEFYISLKTKKGEEVNLIQIVDFNGREVFRSNNKKAAASWKPEANQPKGLYNVNVETNQRKISSRLIRQ